MVTFFCFREISSDNFLTSNSNEPAINRFFLSLFVSIFLGATACNSPKPKTVTILAKGYGAHVELSWPKAENAKSYTILASTDGENFTPIL